MRKQAFARLAFVALIPLAFSIAAPASGAKAGAKLAKLPALGVDANHVTVSGLSSGGFMAAQFSVIHSSKVSGVGIVAGGPYGCGLLGLAVVKTCMSGSSSGYGAKIAAEMNEMTGLIDPLAHVKNQRVYLFRGASDTVVGQGALDALRDFYKGVGVPAENLQYLANFPAEHAFLSLTAKSDCAHLGGPYVNHCGADGTVTGQPRYDQPGAILTKILGGSIAAPATTLSSAPQAFAQSPYLSPLSAMATTGYVYVPKPCSTAGANCRIHVVFHGCEQAAAYTGDAVYGKLGYNAWADTNRIVVLYPQVEKSALSGNPMGCWDWWGYTGPFATRYGPQTQSVQAMIDRLAQTGS